MCTVIIRIPPSADEPVRLMAVRDEDPGRPWRALGTWWPDMPDVVGVQDRLAGGAWLAADRESARLALIVNREGTPDTDRITSRGNLVLGSMQDQAIPDAPTTLGFHLLEVDSTGATVTTWDGRELSRLPLVPGTHMIAHDDVDDMATPRIAAWLPAFAQARTTGEHWWQEWADLLRQTTHLSPTDERAIIRDNRPFGYPTLSLLVVAASLEEQGVDIRNVVLDEPGRLPDTLVWTTPQRD